MNDLATKAALGVCMLLATGSAMAMAMEHVSARVTVVEPTYMPREIAFMMEAGTATCPAGHWFKWRKDAENNKATYATLLSALASGRNVRFYHAVGDRTCTGLHLHAL